MKLNRISKGHYETEYNEFSISVLFHTNEPKKQRWCAYISVSDEQKGAKSHALKSSSKRELVELIVDFCDDPQCFLKIDTSLDLKNLSYEEVEAFFVAPEFIKIVSPYAIKRVQKGNDRYYCTYQEDQPKFYLSVTSFTGKSLPNPFLSKWRGDLGNELADFKSNLAAEYGTFMHIEIGNFIKEGEYNFDNADERVIEYLLSNDLSPKLISEWVDKIHNDMLSFIQFCIDRNVEPIACEFPIVSDRWKLGGCIDFPCKMDFGKKRVNAIVDFKSGRKGFYESHELQLKVYRELWNETFADVIHMTHIFNWAPTEWRCNKPKYKLKNQDNGDLIVGYYLELGLAHSWTGEPKPIKRGMGTVKFGQQDIKGNVSVVSMSNYIKAKNCN